MTYTKRDIVNQAFEDIGLASYVFDLQPQQLNSALRRLDAIAAMWASRGIRTSYPVPNGANNSDLDEQTGFDAEQAYAAGLALAISIAPGFGKTVSPDTRVSARQSYRELLRQSMKPREVQLNNMSVPAGAGHKHWRGGGGPYLSKPTNATALANTSDFNFDFGDLIAGDTYSGVAFELESDAGDPIDLTDATIAATFRFGAVDGPVSLSMTDDAGITVTDAAAGEFSLDAFTVPAAVGQYYSDVEVTFPGGTRHTYIVASMRVLQQVTHG